MSNIQKYDSYTCAVKEFRDLDPRNIKIIDFIDRRNVYATVKERKAIFVLSDMNCARLCRLKKCSCCRRGGRSWLCSVREPNR